MAIKIYRELKKYLDDKLADPKHPFLSNWLYLWEYLGKDPNIDLNDLTTSRKYLVSRLNDDQIISLVSQNMTNVFLYNDHPSARVQEAVYNLLPHWYKFDRFHYHHLGRVANTKIRQKIIHNYPSLVKFLWEPSDRELVQTVLLHPESSVDLILTDSGDVNYKLLALANILLSGADRILAKKYLPGESHKKINHAMKLWAPYWNKILGGKT